MTRGGEDRPGSSSSGDSGSTLSANRPRIPVMLSSLWQERRLDVKVTAVLGVSGPGPGQQSVVLLGVGGRVQVARRRPEGEANEDVLSSVRVFGGGASVHGFRRTEADWAADEDGGWRQRLLVFGGKQLAVICLVASGHTVDLSVVSARPYLAPDWILDVAGPRRLDTREPADERYQVLTAHNRVLSLRFDSSTRQFRLDGDEVKCQEKCILYSGTLLPEDGVVLAGTVFQEIVIWPGVSEASSSSLGDVDRPVWHRLSGHEGVLFSLSFRDYVICSTSDDRTVRLWQVTFGTSTRDGSGRDWSGARIDPGPVLRCHTARVFRHRLLDRGVVVTGGEDSAIAVWRPAGRGGGGGDDEDYTLLRSTHGGSPIWSLDVEEKTGTIVSGGGDGAARSWPLNEAVTVQSIQWPNDLSSEDYPRLVELYENRWIFCLTYRGKVLSFDCEDSQNESCILVDEFSFGSYALMQISDDYLIVATLTGWVWFYRIEGRETTRVQCFFERKMHLFDGKVFSLHIIEPDLILACGINGRMKLFPKLHQNDAETDVLQLNLPKCGVNQQRWVSCATRFKHLLVVGDRSGNLYTYDIGQKDGLGRESPMQSLVKIHSRHGIGDVKVFGHDDDILWTSGRDGVLRQFLWMESECKLEELSECKLPIQWLETILQSSITPMGGRKGTNKFILGFHSSDFHLFSCSEQRALASIPCGGSHRSWAFAMAAKERKAMAKFVFIKDKELFQSNVSLTDKLDANLKQPFHSREISVLHHFELNSKHYVISSGEDVTIKIHLIASEEDQDFGRSCLLTLRSHISNVRAISTRKLRDGTLLMASAGGRAQLKVWQIQDRGKGGLVVSELSTHMLKGDDKRRKKTWKDADIIYDTETRYMDLEILEDVDGGVKIAVVCSDGHLRLLSLESARKKLRLEAESVNIGHCFLKTCLEPKCEQTVWTGSTDGFVRRWTWSPQLAMVSEHRMHKSGVNALYVVDDTGDVVTGGDDGTIALLMRGDSGNRILRFPGSHAAQITGLFAIKSLSSSWLVSCSVDQRLTVWKRETDALALQSQICCDVADIQAMTYWRPKPINEVNDEGLVVAVGGEGLAVFQCLLKT